MELRLEREPSVDGMTPGKLYVDGKFWYFTAEDLQRDGSKVMHETAIPPGRYKVIITRSARFDKMLPLLEDVPGFTGVRIHAGNTAADTSGCILVGMARANASVLSSRVAMDWLQPQIAGALARGEECWITIAAPSTERTLRA